MLRENSGVLSLWRECSSKFRPLIADVDDENRNCPLPTLYLVSTRDLLREQAVQQNKMAQGFWFVPLTRRGGTPNGTSPCPQSF